MKTLVAGLLRRMKHARLAATSRRWHWDWRKVHVRAACRPDALGFKDEWMIDAGYCLDRYTVDNSKEEPQ